MFFVTFLRRELWRRRKQAVVIALGLAVGIGLVITVTAAAAGVRAAQGRVLESLYGVGTDITVTTKPAVASPGGRTRVTISPGGSQVCQGSHCHQGATKLDNLISGSSGPISASEVASIRARHGVTGAAGGLTLSDTQIAIPASVATGGSLPQPRVVSVDGTDLTHPGLGPLSAGRISQGRNLAPSDAHANAAVVGANYATANKLKPGGTITIAKTRFTIVGIVTQPQGASPPDAYIPMARAQALARSDQNKRLTGQVNTIYVAASSAALVPAVAREISRLMPKATVTTSANLACEVTGSLSSTARLANDLGRWLSVLVLAAAVAVASLLTVAAVSRRVREFGTLKALGWRSTRIIAQVMGESLVLGLAGGAAGVGRRDRRRRVAGALEAVGLADRAHHLPAELSGGQQQRVAIARSLVKDPKVLLADEPTGNLDEGTRDEIITLLEKLSAERGLTIVLVTHDSAIARRSPRVAVMSQGRLDLS